MRPIKHFALLCPIFLVSAWASGPVISDVVNYGSRIGTGLPSSGIAQGALLAITGSGLGPDAAVQATFPLPTTDGLGGVTITVSASDGSTVNAILVSAGAREVDAILPSATALGPATVALSYNGGQASFAINVVASAFGIFSSAGTYNVAGDGSVAFNTPYQTAVPGQTVYINGTGLGAIGSDETQSGVTDVPASVANGITVWIGTTQANVVSAGRGTCCTGLSPTFPIPQGIAAWDVIAFTIPDGVQGCEVSVAVQIGSSVSNVATMSVSSDGTTCIEASSVNGGSPITVQGMVKQGLVTNYHVETIQNLNGAAIDSTSVSSTAIFLPVDYGPDPVSIPPLSSYLTASAGSCSVYSTRQDRSIKVDPPPPSTANPLVPLDAGPALNITTSTNIHQILKKLAGIYNGTVVISKIGVPGLPPSTTGGPDFLLPGPYTFDNGSGGADIGPFSVTLKNPTPVKWDNLTDLATSGVNRPDGVTVNWSSGDPNGVLAITGTSIRTEGTVVYAGLFTCYANVSAGTFTVPPYVTQQLPASGQLTSGGIGQMTLDAVLADVPAIPGVDITYYFSLQSVGTAVAFR